MADNKVSHLEMIQDVIKRMADNSFKLKGWTVTLVSAAFALSAKDRDRFYIIIAFFPTILFWMLDAYYLNQERLYRGLFNTVATKNEEEIDFSMTTQDTFSSFAGSAVSKTVLFFYLPILGVILWLSVKP